jgi:hypothetical protein
MADTFAIDGSWTCEPRSTGQQSSDPSLDAPLAERVALEAKEQGTYTLSSAAVVPVSLGGIDLAVGAAVVMLRAVGGKVKARLTSADGAVQCVPVDPLCIVISGSVPFTAIDLTRDPGISTAVVVKVFLGQKA